MGVAANMSHGTRKALVLIGLAYGLSGCGAGSASSRSPSALAPSAPSAVITPQSDAGSLVVFKEPATGFSTTDLRDAHDRIIQMTNGGDLIWTPDGTHIPSYEISPGTSAPTYFIGPKTRVCVEFCAFSVRFGASNGERRAYLTIDYGHSNPGTLVDVEVREGTLIVNQTALFPPGTPTLSGRVTEMTAAGQVPVAGAEVYRSVPAGWQFGVSDKDGIYKIFGLIDGTTTVATRKEGYENQDTKDVAIQGDTRFDIQLVRK